MSQFESLGAADGVGAQAQSSVVAGRSARSLASGAESAAAILDKKSEYARRRAANFRQGAQGELDTARALAELSLDGWLVLHDRLLLEGGNIDHLLVGPGGVVVVDSKSWSGTVVVTPGHELRVGGRSKAREVSSVATVAAAVEQAIRAAGHEAPVRSVVALTQEPPPSGAARLAAGPLVVGVDGLAAAVRALPEVVRPAQIDALVATVLGAFPSADRTMQEAVEMPADRKPVRELFLRANVFLFVEPWSRSGHRRLYLNDVEGTSLGYKNLVTGEITVSEEEQRAVVQGVLRDAHAGGLSLSRSALPKIPPRLPGGRVLGKLGGLWCNLLVAQHWRKGPKDRLYVTLADLDQGIFELGHIDLDSGMVHPSSNEPLAKDLGEPRRYLEIVAERYPRR